MNARPPAAVPAPRVAIVVATFNRSNILGFTLATAQWQTIQDWELIVVGDACTDDTAAVVERLADPRCRFVNLARNHGEQSGPNNEGVARTSADLIAFLNHDDLWFPDHLQSLVDTMADPAVDVAYSASIVIGADGVPRVSADAPDGQYRPWHVVPASTWLCRRRAVERIGPWRPAHLLHTIPSQDWMFRAHRAGLVLRPLPRLSVIQPNSGARRQSYAERHWHEHDALFRGMRDEPDYRQRLLETMVLAASPQVEVLAPMAHLTRALRAVVYRVGLAFGVPPMPLMNVLRGGRRGGYIDRMRAVRGLPPMEPPPG